MRYFAVSVSTNCRTPASRSDRILFVGDNLGVTPMTGEGLGICLSSARAAAQESLAALGSGDYSFRRYPMRLVSSDFIPTWFPEHVFVKWKSPFLFNLFFLLATDVNRPESFMKQYCRVFAGEVPPKSLEGWSILARVFPSRGLIKRLLRESTGTGP